MTQHPNLPAKAAPFPFGLDRDSRVPFYRQLRERIAAAIGQGLLQPGERLPSVRSLASQLATSRGTVELAYSLLANDGHVESQGAAGTVVSNGPAAQAALPESRLTPPALSPAAGHFRVRPFAMGLPALDEFPAKAYARLAARRARECRVEEMGYPPPEGYAPLRRAISAYLAVSRGVRCSPEQVVVTSGLSSAIGLLVRALDLSGASAWMEDPGFPLVRTSLLAAGVNAQPVPVDAEGLNVEAGIRRFPSARLAYVTPSHQAPLGVTMTAGRREALLAWASGSKAWVIEDDYDGEFRYNGRPIPALKSLDREERVLYVGSFSKVLFPGLRLGYLVAPPALVERFRQASLALYWTLALLPQSVVADFMVEGHFARHVKRMRSLYAERRRALSAALHEQFGRHIELQLREGGMHLLARFPGLASDLEAETRAFALGMAPAALSRWHADAGQTDRDHRGLLLSFTNVPAAEAHRAADLLKQAL